MHTDRHPSFLSYINPQQTKILIDASAGLSLGVIKGLDQFSKGVRPFLKEISALVCSPGQLNQMGPLNRGDASILVRVDWTNTIRGEGFVLPVTESKYVPILTARDAMDVGADGMVTTILLGYDESIEADSIRGAVQMAMNGRTMGLPLVVEVRADGSRVSLFGKAVELGASYALEGGADGIAVPYPGSTSLKTLGQFVSVPWFLKPTSLAKAQVELMEAIDCGAAGLWLDHTIFGLEKPVDYLLSLKTDQPSGLGKV